jgi:hypothetical protein
MLNTLQKLNDEKIQMILSSVNMNNMFYLILHEDFFLGGGFG